MNREESRDDSPQGITLGRQWRWISRLGWALPALPFLFLASFLANAPHRIPAFLLPERSYLALSSGVSPELFAQARGRGEAFLVLSDRLSPLPPRFDAASLDKARASLPERACLGPIAADLAAGIGLWKRARIVSSELPSAAETALVGAAAEKTGTPLSFTILDTRMDLPLLAFQRLYAPKDKERRFELLLAPEARSYDRVEVAAIEAATIPTGAFSSSPAGTEALVRGARPLLYSASGAELPADLALRLSGEGAESIELSFLPASGPALVRNLDLGGEATELPRVLVVSSKAQVVSFIERAYDSRRANPAEATALDLHAYELIVLDGLPLAGIGGPLLDGLVDAVERRTGSLLFVADSPDFGTKGANPALEELLPATLLPRSLKDQPDVAMLVLVDASGSMFGEKLSLAKVTGLELLRGLKDGDLVGLGLFSDRRRWLYGFAPVSGLEAAPELGPLSAGGGTDLYAALSDGLDRLTRTSLERRHAVLITDGVTKPADFRGLAERARALGVTISAMGVGEDADRAFLERLALGSGGRYYPVASADEIPSLIVEDRSSVARPAFAQGRMPILALDGKKVATVEGMAQYTATPTAEVLLSNELGDPLFATREAGNRAVLLFASDIYGTYTSALFASHEAAGIVRDRLDALFAEHPARVSVTEAERGLVLYLKSDRLAAPRLLLSRAGETAIEVPFRRVGASGWAAEAAPPATGRWNASVLDRGAALASFPVAVNGGISGTRADAAAALAGHRPLPFRSARSPVLWLGLFFAASLACTVYLRARR